MIQVAIRRADVLATAEDEFRQDVLENGFGCTFDFDELDKALERAPRNRAEYRAWLKGMPRTVRLASKRDNPLARLLAGPR